MKIANAERLLEDIGGDLLAQPPATDAVWAITAFGLAAHGRAHHRALLHGLAGPSPHASAIHARPIVESVILIDYLAEDPDVRVWIWVADGVCEERTLLREWLKAVEAGHNDHATPELLTALIDQKTALIEQVEGQARKAAAAKGEKLASVELPSVRSRAKRDPNLFSLYTEAFRHLSGHVHVAATLFTKDRLGDVDVILTDSATEEDRIAIRALAAASLAVLYAASARALGFEQLWDRTAEVHAAMTGL